MMAPTEECCIREGLIHRSAWKRNSRKFAVASDSSKQRQSFDNSPCFAPLGSKRSDLVAVVAPFCIKRLRLVTVQLPEKSWPIEPGTNRSSHIWVSRKLPVLSDLLPANTRQKHWNVTKVFTNNYQQIL